jgi:hypothetical protein
MAYIGNNLTVQQYAPTIQYFSGNASTTIFTLSIPVVSAAQIIVTVENVIQNPASAYTVSGTTLTFTSAPPSNTNNIWVEYTSLQTSVNALPYSPSIQGTTTFDNPLTYGATGIIASFASSTNSYNQIVSQNSNSGTSASSDFIVSNDQATDSTNYGDFGINSSGFSGSGPFSIAGGVYNYAASGTMSVGTSGSQPLYLATNNTTAITVDASQNVGIGVTPNTWYSGYTVNQIGAGGTAGYYAPNTEFDIINNCYRNASGNWIYQTSNYATIYQSYQGKHIWYNAPSGTAAGAVSLTQAMTLDNSGSWMVGTTASGNQNSNNINYVPSNGQGYVGHVNGTSSGQGYWVFAYNGGGIGSITQNGTTAVAYNTTSDYRLKTDVAPIQNALATINALNPISFIWVDGRKDDGFIAHELQAVIPNCVTGEKDAVNEDGTPKYQQMDNSGVVPFLVKAIQEQQALITSLTARITALEGAK